MHGKQFTRAPQSRPERKTDIATKIALAACQEICQSLCMDVDQIIAAVGGREAVIRELGASRTATYNWRRDGIPARLWPDFVARAAVAGVEGVTFDALKATRRSAQASAA